MEITVKIEKRNDNLKERRQAAGLSQSQLAKLAGVGVRVYQNYEQGVRDVSKAQLSTLERTNQGVGSEEDATVAQIMQLDDQIGKCRITSPVAGTVLAKYAEAGEVAAAGKPLFKVADLQRIFLRAYVGGEQLSNVKLGQQVKVYADEGADGRREYAGRVTWISGQAEFTPKTIQTRDERTNLVYAVKIAVENDGLLKLGMYGEVDFE